MADVVTANQASNASQVTLLGSQKSKPSSKNRNSEKINRRESMQGMFGSSEDSATGNSGSYISQVTG